MQKYRVIFQGKTKTGKEIIIRYPAITDAQALTNHINTLSQERTFILRQGEQISLDDETKYLKDWLKKIKEEKLVMLLAFHKNKLIGNSMLGLQEKVHSHVGSFSISIAKDYRKEGIGKTLMDSLLKEAKKKLPQMKLVTLTVFSNNPIAIPMYQKFGFIQYGNLPQGILYKGKYIDHLLMYKKI